MKTGTRCSVHSRAGRDQNEGQFTTAGTAGVRAGNAQKEAVKHIRCEENGDYTFEEFNERKTLNEKRQEEVRSEMERLIFNNQNVINALRDSSVSAKNKNVLMKEIIEKIDYTKVDGVLYLDVFYR